MSDQQVTGNEPVEQVKWATQEQFDAYERRLRHIEGVLLNLDARTMSLESEEQLKKAETLNDILCDMLFDVRVFWAKNHKPIPGRFLSQKFSTKLKEIGKTSFGHWLAEHDGAEIVVKTTESGGKYIWPYDDFFSAIKGGFLGPKEMQAMKIID